MQLDIRDNIAEVLRRVEHHKADIPVATSKALNYTLFKVRDEEVAEMQRVFDRPTRFTLNALFVRRATAADLQGRVFLKEQWPSPSQHYLRPEIYGGARVLKGFERVMRQAGLLPAGMFAVPGSAAKIDAYGNMSRGQLLKIMSALRLAERTSGYSANRTAASSKRRRGRMPQYFVGRPGFGKAPLGVWETVRFAFGSAVRPVLIFVKQPSYTAVFNFHQVAQKVAAQHFQKQFAIELARLAAMRGAG